MKKLEYRPSVTKGSLHMIQIDDEKLETTVAKEVIKFAKARIDSRNAWKALKEAVRLAEPLTIAG